MRGPTRRQEILNSTDCATVQREQLLELIAVVFTKDYITHDVEVCVSVSVSVSVCLCVCVSVCVRVLTGDQGCNPENVFVCYSTYSSKDRTIRIFKSTRMVRLDTLCVAGVGCT
jgi:hypothetical protein